MKVKTGVIFGEYYYGNVLGPKALETVPWLIPLSWFMFMYVSTITVDAALAGIIPAGWRCSCSPFSTPWQ